MKILVYIGHPAQFHFFKNAISKFRESGHEVIILIKTKDILEQLLQESGLKYRNIQEKGRGKSKLAILKASILRTWRLYKIAKKENVDILTGTDSSIAQAAWLLRKPAITTLEDDYAIIKHLAKLTYPFTTKILVPKVCDVGKWENKKVGYDGYMKLAYLHPKYFVPDNNVINKYNLPQKFILLRLAQLTAHHDIGIKGLDFGLVKKIIDIAHNNGYDVRISSEISLPGELKSKELNIRHTDIHHIMYFASMLISDSQSMSVEASMLGLPSIRFSDFYGRISVLEELEKKYGLTKGFLTSDSEKMLAEIKKLLSNVNLRKEFQIKRQKMLSEKIDVTEMLVNEILTTVNQKQS